MFGLWILVFSSAARDLPRPSSGHPGNIFLSGEPITFAAPNGEWRLADYEDRVMRQLSIANGRVDLAPLSPGWYRLRSPDQTNRWISFAVLEPLSSPTPSNSPISIDVAMSWFYPTNKMRDAAALCALAGVNWVRDRLSWPDMEPERGRFAAQTRYDAAARAQSEAGLQVLQVNHITPKWAGPNAKHFPSDLRDVFEFYRSMAARWKGQVSAFEPWNEADIVEFGGHTGAEMASLQKAAYLGLKAGNPQVIVCQNVWAAHRRAQLDDFAANHASAYFDIYNLHHYEPVNRYPALYADHRAVSAGKPMWVSEFAMPVKWSGDEKLKEPPDAELRVQSERLVKAFAASLFEGVQNSFYFMFPHYVEGQTQFGIVRPDLTPRPAYLSLCAVGRLLRDERPLGRLAETNGGVHGYLFSTGDHELLIAWSDKAAQLRLPASPTRRADHLGRWMAAQPGLENTEIALTPAPQFLLLPSGTGKMFDLVPPPAPAALLNEPRSRLVLQPLLPAERVALAKSAWRIVPEAAAQARLAAYNFGSQRATVTLKVTAPNGWKVDYPRHLVLDPAGREEIPLTIDCSMAKAGDVATLTAELAGPDAITAVLSFQFVIEK